MIQILTNKEKKIIEKKLSNKKLTQIESNRLSKSIRPKLREISLIDSKYLINQLEYSQKVKAIEKRIIKVINNNLEQVNSIILYGSAIQNNYHIYNDIDIIIVTKKQLYIKKREKWKKIQELKKILKKYSINADIQIYPKKAFLYNSARNPDLIYQLNDYKMIYGKIKLPKKKEIYNADLHMKLDWSDIYDNRPEGNEIYHALRNTVLVSLLLNKIIDNRKLKESLYEELGKNLIDRLKNNKESKLDRKIALSYLNELIKKTRKEIKGGLWEKIEL